MNKPTLIVIACGVLVIAAGAFWILKNRKNEFPLIYNPANLVSSEEIKQIEQVVRAKGERYVISINIVGAAKAGAHTGDGSHEPRSGRKYDLSRTSEGWKIDAVEEWKN